MPKPSLPTKPEQQAIVPILEVAGLRSERYGLTIKQGFIVPLRLVNGEWHITGSIPRKLAEYLPAFIQQHDALIERHGIPSRQAFTHSVTEDAPEAVKQFADSISKPTIRVLGRADATGDVMAVTAASQAKPIRTKPIGVLGTPKPRTPASKKPSRKKVT